MKVISKLKYEYNIIELLIIIAYSGKHTCLPNTLYIITITK